MLYDKILLHTAKPRPSTLRPISHQCGVSALILNQNKVFAPPPPPLKPTDLYFLTGRCEAVLNKGVGPDPTLAWPGWKQPDISVEVDTDRLETSHTEVGVLKKLSLAGLAKLSRLMYS
jgi:hypothetical protein